MRNLTHTLVTNKYTIIDVPPSVQQHNARRDDGGDGLRVRRYRAMAQHFRQSFAVPALQAASEWIRILTGDQSHCEN